MAMNNLYFAFVICFSLCTFSALALKKNVVYDDEIKVCRVNSFFYVIFTYFSNQII